MILITGGTGFIGGELVMQSLRDRVVRAMKPLYLVRADNKKQGLMRLKDNVQNYIVDQRDEEVFANLNEEMIICGDLSTDLSFLNPMAVINPAAIATFNNSNVFQVNVDDTLKFHAQFPHAQIIQFGTAFACGKQPKNAVINEQTTPGKQFNDYTQSKLDMEMQVGPNVKVVKPAIVMGHSRLGCFPSTSLFWLFVMIEKLGGFTFSLDQKIDIVPVDYVATCAFRLLAYPHQKGAFYLTAGDRSCTFGELLTAMTGSSDWYEQHTVKELQAKVDELGLSKKEAKIWKTMIEWYGPFAELGYTFSNNRIHTISRIHADPFSSYIKHCYDTVENTPMMVQMQPELKGKA